MKKLFFILLSIQFLFASATQQLKSGEAITKTVKEREKQFYKITVPKNKSVRVNLTKLEADVYLYVKKGNKVRFRFNDCYSSQDNSSNQECILVNEGETSEYSIFVYGAEESKYKIKATIEKAVEIPVLTNETIEDSVDYKKSKQYKISGEKGKIITVTLSDLSADADLRVKFGRKASINTFDCKSTNGGTNTDECKITPKEDGTVYIQVYGYREATYSLKASKKTNFLFKLEEILEKANNAYQDNENCESKKIVCADKGDKLIYILEDEYEFEGAPLVKSSLYAVSSTHHIHQVQKTKTWRKSNSSLIKLKNTDLIALKIPDELHSLNYTLNVYNKSSRKEVISMHILEYDQIGLKEIKTIEDGSKLIISYWETKEGTDTLYQDTYDITDTTNVKIITKHIKV